MTTVDLSEMSEWDDSQSPPSLSLTQTPQVPPPSRAYRQADMCLTGNCAGCGKQLISAVEVEFRRQVHRGGKVFESVAALHCGSCYDWTAKR